MATKTPGRGKGSRIAREGSEDVVPVDPETVYGEEGGEEELVVDTGKTPRRNKRGRQRAGTVSEADDTETQEPRTVKKPGKGRAGKKEEVEPKLPIRTPAKGRPRKNSRPAQPKAIEPNDQDLPDYEDEEEEGPTLFFPKPTTKKKSAKGREPAAEPELDPVLEEGAAGPSNALRQELLIQTTKVEEVQQKRPVKAKAAEVQQAGSAVSQPTNQHANQPNQPTNQPSRQFLSWTLWALPFLVLGALFSGILHLAYIQFEEVNSTMNTRVKTVEQQLEKVMNPEIPTPEPRRVDWFSFGLGALPLLNLCTPPYHIPLPDPPKKTWPWSKPVPVTERDKIGLNRLEVGRIVSQLNASQALLHWNEPSPRYCVRASGKLQLAVYTPRNITPTEMVIEDYHKDEAIGMGTAPRDIELWMSTTSPEDRQFLNAQLNEKHKHIRAIRPTRTPGPALSPGSDQLNADWFPIGRWRYNIYAENNIQKFKIPLEMGDIIGRNFAVRVSNNWGDDELMCLVRARLHGIDRTKVPERLLPERGVAKGKRQVAKDSE